MAVSEGADSGEVDVGAVKRPSCLRHAGSNDQP